MQFFINGQKIITLFNKLQFRLTRSRMVTKNYVLFHVVHVIIQIFITTLTIRLFIFLLNGIYGKIGLSWLGQTLAFCALCLMLFLLHDFMTEVTKKIAFWTSNGIKHKWVQHTLRHPPGKVK